MALQRRLAVVGMSMRPTVGALAVSTALLLLTGCTAADGEPQSEQSAATTPSTPAPATDETTSDQPRPSSPSVPTGTTSNTNPPPTTKSPPRATHFRQTTAMATVRHLALDIGPRLATSPEFDRAADWVQRRLAGYGFHTSRQTVRVPAGDSWGVPVDAGTSANVIATPPGFDPAEPWRLVGAHLDTVAVAPGAEDNGSGIAVLLELARLAAAGDTSLPTVFVAFGAEEPVGSGDALHHFGSRLHVDRLPAGQLRTLRAMVSLDRVGVGDAETVPVCTGGLSPLRVRDELISVARRLGFGTLACMDNTTSDHWSYEQRGVAVARVGSTPYSEYHSASDVPDVVAPHQLGRVGRLMWAWLRD